MALEVSINFVDGSHQSWSEPETLFAKLQSLRNDGYEGKELVHQLLTDDWGPPPRGVKITGTLSDGTTVDEYLPY